MQSHPCLNTGLFIRAEDEIVRAQRLSFPAPGIEVEDVASLDGKLRIAGKDPRPVLPWPDRVLVQPSPDGLVTDAGDDPGTLGLAHDISGAQPRQRHAERGGQFTREGLYLDHDRWGKKLGGDPSADARRDPADVHRKTACATD